MLKVSVFVCALGVALATYVQPAAADGWPPSVQGSWSILSNVAPGNLNITTQSNSGQCQFITGTIYGEPMQGYYCVNSGRIQFIRKRADNNDTIQIWTGNVSQGESGSTLHMGGTFSVVDPAGGSFGEYNFNANK
jgi:hypothetical protein